MQKSEAIVRAKFPEAWAVAFVTRDGSTRHVIYSAKAAAKPLSARHTSPRLAWNRAARNVLATS